MNEMQSNRKKFLGFFAITAFLVIIILMGGGFERIDNSFREASETIAQLFGTRQSLTVRTSELVEEESAVIEVVERVSPSVVSILVRSVSFDPFSGPFMSESGVGTGFIVSSNGLIVTNSHVVSNPSGAYSVVLKDGTSYEVAEIHLDEISDLAILEIPARNLPTVEFGDSDTLRVGQRAIAIGNALGRFQNTVTSGIVSGISRELTASSGFGGQAKTYEGAIQTDAALNPGNSGGPLLNSGGQVIGINVATTTGADNISFAIPVNVLKPILETFLREGRIIRPYLGISYTMITSEIAAVRDLPVGAYVSIVMPDSSAQEAGLAVGDIILSFDGTKLQDGISLSQLITKKKVGDTVEIVVDRNGAVLTLHTTLQEAQTRR